MSKRKVSVSQLIEAIASLPENPSEYYGRWNIAIPSAIDVSVMANRDCLPKLPIPNLNILQFTYDFKNREWVLEC